MKKYTDTTVKLESSLVREVSAVLEPDQTLTAYVRDVIRSDVRRRKLKQAAGAYQVFLAQNPQEQRELDAWEEADLAKAPGKTRSS